MIHAVTLHRPDDLDEFRAAARRLLAAEEWNIRLARADSVDLLQLGY